MTPPRPTFVARPDDGLVPLAPTEKLSAPDMVRAGLRQAIFDGAFAAGEQLRQDDLAARFGTSRIPVREALRQLEAEGLVTLVANKGAVVTTLSIEEVLELQDIRIGLECRALKLAIPNMAVEDFEHLEGILRSYDGEALPARWSEQNESFHLALYDPCQRPRLLAMIQTTWRQIDRFSRMQVSLAAGKEQPMQDHRQLLEACRAGDVSRAVERLEEHILQTQKSLVAAARRGDRRPGRQSDAHQPLSARRR